MLAGILCLTSLAWAQSYSACDLNHDGAIDNTDVTLAVNMVLGNTPCTANIEGALTCSVITIQRVINASQGQSCVTFDTPSHSVTLNWLASISSNVAGYNIYRGTSSGGPYSTKVNPVLVTGTSYTDTTVQAGETYYYVATAADSGGGESGYSNEAVAAIPSP